MDDPKTALELARYLFSMGGRDMGKTHARETLAGIPADAVAQIADLQDRLGAWRKNAHAASTAATAERGRAEKAEARVKELEALLGTEHPWPLVDTLKKLAVATKHLLHDHNCDCTGYEEFIQAVNMSGYYIAKGRELLES